MSPPLSLATVLTMLRRISPEWPSTEPDTDVGKELGSIATAIAMVKDQVDGLVDELFPDTTTFLLGRWEKATGVATILSDSLATRRARVIAVLRRIKGPRISQLEQMLTGPLALDPSDMIWVEPLRSFIDEALTETTGAVALAVPTIAPGLTVALGRPWPGVVDDTGVRVYIALGGIGATVATLAHPDGTTWTIPVTAATGWYWNRSTFTGKPAAGTWKLNIVDSSAPSLSEFRLLVSNNIDSGQIANFFVLRDPSLPGSPDLVTAQRLFHDTALGHNRAFVVERLAFTLGDPRSLLGRDPMGA